MPWDLCTPGFVKGATTKISEVWGWVFYLQVDAKSYLFYIPHMFHIQGS